VFVNDATLASGGTDNRIWIWDLKTRQPTRRLEGHTGTVAALACDARGATLVSGSYDTTLRIWDLSESATPEVAQGADGTVR
jgi:WD40 repeat protein